MKITAILPDDLVDQVKRTTGGKNITDSLKIALEAYLSHQKIQQAMEAIDRDPFLFREGFSAEKVRELNRNR